MPVFSCTNQPPNCARVEGTFVLEHKRQPCSRCAPGQLQPLSHNGDRRDRRDDLKMLDVYQAVDPPRHPWTMYTLYTPGPLPGPRRTYTLEDLQRPVAHCGLVAPGSVFGTPNYGPSSANSNQTWSSNTNVVAHLTPTANAVTRPTAGSYHSSYSGTSTLQNQPSYAIPARSSTLRTVFPDDSSRDNRGIQTGSSAPIATRTMSGEAICPDPIPEQWRKWYEKPFSQADPGHKRYEQVIAVAAWTQLRTPLPYETSDEFVYRQKVFNNRNDRNTDDLRQIYRRFHKVHLNWRPLDQEEKSRRQKKVAHDERYAPATLEDHLEQNVEPAPWQDWRNDPTTTGSHAGWRYSRYKRALEYRPLWPSPLPYETWKNFKRRLLALHEGNQDREDEVWAEYAKWWMDESSLLPTYVKWGDSKGDASERERARMLQVELSKEARPSEQAPTNAIQPAPLTWLPPSLPNGPGPASARSNPPSIADWAKSLGTNRGGGGTGSGRGGKGS